jgi:allantoin racemase
VAGKVRTKRIRVVVPVSTAVWNAPARNLLEGYKDANTQIDIVNIKDGPKAIECCYDEVFAASFLVQEAERAEQEGYHGVIDYCFDDPGLRAAKERLSIPVVGLGEASFHIASLLGNRFSVISAGPPDCTFTDIKDLLKLYGFADECASVRSVAIPILQLENGRDTQAKRLLEEAQKAVEGDGADVIVLGCGSILVPTEGILALGVPVVVPGIAALKLCEDLIDMKLSQSKQCFRIPNRRSGEPT